MDSQELRAYFQQIISLLTDAVTHLKTNTDQMNEILLEEDNDEEPKHSIKPKEFE